MTAPPAVNLRPAALSILREGRLTLLAVVTDEDDMFRLTSAVGQVKGHYGTYVVDYMFGAWSCTCRNWMSGERRPCAHIHAVQMVTRPEGIAA